MTGIAMSDVVGAFDKELRTFEGIIDEIITKIVPMFAKYGVTFDHRASHWDDPERGWGYEEDWSSNSTLPGHVSIVVTFVQGEFDFRLRSYYEPLCDDDEIVFNLDSDTVDEWVASFGVLIPDMIANRPFTCRPACEYWLLDG